jgi:hypothetical protein
VRIALAENFEGLPWRLGDGIGIEEHHLMPARVDMRKRVRESFHDRGRPGLGGESRLGFTGCPSISDDEYRFFLQRL